MFDQKGGVFEKKSLEMGASSAALVHHEMDVALGVGCLERLRVAQVLSKLTFSPFLST